MYGITAIGSRGVLFSTDTIPGCATYAYLIKGIRANYLVDTGLGSTMARFIKGYMAENCPNDAIVINTHHHWDHIWGNVGFEGSRILAHHTAKGLIEQKWDEMEQRYGKWKEGYIKKALPDTPVDDYFYFTDDEIEIFHSPGHTGDSLSIYDRIDRVLHVGDNVEGPVPGIYDTKENCRSSLKKYLGYGFSRCISGHNGNVSREDIEAALGALEPSGEE